MHEKTSNLYKERYDFVLKTQIVVAHKKVR